MLEYSISKAKEIAKYEGDQEETVFYIPKQLVIFIEQNSSIKDELRLKLIFPDGQEINYRVPVMKYWEYSKEEILEQKLYPLLPLQVFKLRYQMEKIKNRKNHTEHELQELIQKAQQIVEEISNEAARLFKAEEIDGEDLHKILLANEELFRYLNSRYVNDEKLNEEVLSMTRTLYNPIVAEKAKLEGRLEGKLEGKLEGMLEGKLEGMLEGKLEGMLEGKLEAARNAVKKGFSLEDIAEITDLPLETVQKLKAELSN
ncbi:hypothetical protein [Desulfosporosinus metallidurans]|uniref:Cytochrome c-type biogenesis protein ResA n=1 Tax=Desulfosporosinus metallidurans TaxID=1888891 RepID=A0A1Q8QY29_9FIRM|nr:hypothetical protein [Desulfosporosinus metallidurans]OLN32241.1 Cytochrome c-type biogenesis protein ResA [Desulfosporosinus metallidurans]